MPFKATAQNALPVAGIAGRQVSLELVRREDFSPVKWPDENVALTIEDVEIKDGDIIPELLEARGIVPDNESYTLFYDLNPLVDNLEQVVPHSKYKLPKVTGGQRLDESLKKNCWVLLTVDKDLKAKLKKNSKAMTSLAQRFSKLRRSRFKAPKRSETAKRYIRDLAGWYDHIYKTIAQRKAKPMRKVSLLQIVNEAESLTKLLSKVVKSKRKVRSADYAQIVLIHQDIEAITDRWDERMAGELPLAEPQYEVEVVIRGKNSSAVRNLRVYYVINGYYRAPPTNPPVRSSSFNSLGQRVSETLPVHKYKIWVAKDGEPGNPLIKAREVWVNKKTSVEFSLQ
jgi:hypothetical protein